MTSMSRLIGASAMSRHSSPIAKFERLALSVALQKATSSDVNGKSLIEWTELRKRIFRASSKAVAL